MLSGKHYYESYRGVIKPSRIIYMNHGYKITNLHSNYNIKKYYIVVNNKDDNIFEDLIIRDCFHPNAFGGENGDLDINYPPKYSKFCLPEWIFGSQLINSDIHQKIFKGKIPKPRHNVISDMYIKLAFLSIWCLDNPHHQPIKEYVKTDPILPFF